jgi:ubiquinone biosynthesis protein
LENWVKEQVGPVSVLKQMYANLPFWAEKMPELPDLIYQNLKQKKQHTVQPAVSSQKPILLGMLASSLLIVSGLSFLAAQTALSTITLIASIGAFLTAWRKTG